MNLILNSIESISKNSIIKNSIIKNSIIKISAELYDNSIKIFVEDNGPGIAQEDQDHIFNRYFTGKTEERKLGAGLGLYVCKKLMELHNGEISVKSRQNEYTRFTIILPFNYIDASSEG